MVLLGRTIFRPRNALFALPYTSQNTLSTSAIKLSFLMEIRCSLSILFLYFDCGFFDWMITETLEKFHDARKKAAANEEMQHPYPRFNYELSSRSLMSERNNVFFNLFPVNYLLFTVCFVVATWLQYYSIK